MITTIIVIIFIVLIFFILLFALLYPEIKRTLEKHFYRKKIYKVLHYYAEENDELLINDIDLYLSQSDEDLKSTHFDHILLTKKYVYVFLDFYAYGGLYGNLNDNYLFLKNYHNKVQKIINPVLANEINVKKLEHLVHNPNEDEEPSCFVSVVCYNNSLIVSDNLKKNQFSSVFIPYKNLAKEIKVIEQDDVPLIPDALTEALVNNIKKRSDDIKEDIRSKKKRRK